MKTILVPVGGSDTDEVVFETALTVARPLAAHLEFLHIRVGAGGAALHTPHVAFARGAALRNALDDLAQQGESRAATAAITFASSAYARSSTWSTSLACRKSSLLDGGKKREMHSNA